jgi:hypothetical protein
VKVAVVKSQVPSVFETQYGECQGKKTASAIRFLRCNTVNAAVENLQVPSVFETQNSECQGRKFMCLGFKFLRRTQ